MEQQGIILNGHAELLALIGDEIPDLIDDDIPETIEDNVAGGKKEDKYNNKDFPLKNGLPGSCSLFQPKPTAPTHNLFSSLYLRRDNAPIYLKNRVLRI